MPWVSKRQKLIDKPALPDDIARFTLATLAALLFVDAGLTPIEIHHFARSGDALDVVFHTGRLRRSFQEYTADTCPTLIGLRASSISRFPAGYVQNAPATAAYIQRIGAGEFAGSRGYALSEDDTLRARAIELLMCNFQLDLSVSELEFGPRAGILISAFEDIAEKFSPFVTWDSHRLKIVPEGRSLTRMIAAAFDQHMPDRLTYSRAT